jgi:hypothetical protein
MCGSGVGAGDRLPCPLCVFCLPGISTCSTILKLPGVCPWVLFVCLFFVFFFFPLCFYGSFITWTWLIKSLAIGDQLITGASKQLLSQKHWLLTWAQKVTRSREKPDISVSILSVSFVLSHSLWQAPWIQGMTGLIDNIVMTKDKPHRTDHPLNKGNYP